MSQPVIRPIVETDSLEELTELLHRAYARLAAMGLRFFATHQTVEQTRSRVRSGRCFIAESDGGIVGTITLYQRKSDEGPAWYRRDGVGYFGQFGVEPGLQGRGIGNLLLEHVESEARTLGLEELALDTAESATHLIEYYARHGYREVDGVQWKDVNYRSVVMSKTLRPPEA
jgi:GNAT superfamily N-acetyltransferase